MKEFEIQSWIREKSKNLSQSLGPLKNSIEEGEGNEAGFIGEHIALKILGGKLVNTYDYDLITKKGIKVDVKTKRTKVKPQPHHECSIAGFNINQECDYYAFVRVDMNLNKAWWLGVCSKKRYFEDCYFLRKGYYCENNKFTVKADCFNLKIEELCETVD